MEKATNWRESSRPFHAQIIEECIDGSIPLGNLFSIRLSRVAQLITCGLSPPHSRKDNGRISLYICEDGVLRSCMFSPTPERCSLRSLTPIKKGGKKKMLDPQHASLKFNFHRTLSAGAGPAAWLFAMNLFQYMFQRNIKRKSAECHERGENKNGRYVPMQKKSDSIAERFECCEWGAQW